MSNQQWTITVVLGDQASTAHAPDWLAARSTLARAIAAIYKAGRLPEPVTRMVLTLLTEAKPPHPAMGSWVVAAATPECRFHIQSPLGVSLKDVS